MVVFAKEITMMPACPLSCPRSRAYFSLASLKPVENRYNTSAFLSYGTVGMYALSPGSNCENEDGHTFGFFPTA